jgi:hypothetical protein
MANYEIPSYRLTKCLFTPMESVGRARIGGGTSLALTETMDTVWQVQIETPPLTAAERAAWRAWRGKLRGGLDTFSLYDVSKANPLNYPDADSSFEIGSSSPSWDGTADVTSVGASGALALAGLPANYVVSAGDYIGLEESSRYDLYVASAAVTANGSGVATVSVRPYLRSGIFTSSAVARLWRPVATFVFDPESWSEEAGVSPTPISFSGVQRI